MNDEDYQRWLQSVDGQIPPGDTDWITIGFAILFLALIAISFAC